MKRPGSKEDEPSVTSSADTDLPDPDTILPDGDDIGTNADTLAAESFSMGDTFATMNDSNTTNPDLRAEAAAILGDFATAATRDNPRSNDPPTAALPVPEADSQVVPVDVRRDNRYQGIRLIGSGGVAEVTECSDSLLGRNVAMKTLLRDAGRKGESSLAREARITARLEHPNIIPVYDIGTTEGRSFFVMKLLTEPGLNKVLSRLRHGDPEALNRYTRRRMLRYFIQICQAVDYAHSRGVIHCDLKPANILLGAFGEVLVVDWGIAYSSHSGSGIRGGTPGYMAPEQFCGRNDHYDARVDVFALGAVLYELLCYRQAFIPPPRAEVKQHLRQELPTFVYPAPSRPSERSPELGIPEELETICLRAIAHAADARWGSARELAFAIEQFLEGTLERERREGEAARHSERGAEFTERYEELLETRPQEVNRVRELAQSVVPWSSTKAKGELWDAEDLLAVTEALRTRTLRAALSAFEEALDELPSDSIARKGLARLYWIELQRARERRDELEQIYFADLVQNYDDGTYSSRIDADSRVVVKTAGTPTELRFAEYIERDRRMVPLQPRIIGSMEAFNGVALRPGSYLLSVNGHGRTARYPLHIEPGNAYDLNVDTVPLATLGADELFIPGGPALIGGHESELRSVDIPSFVMSRASVTFAEYLEFIRDLSAAGDHTAADRRLPRSEVGTPYWSWETSRWEPTHQFAPGTRGELLDLPAFGLRMEDASAFTGWRRKQSGLSYRLPTEDEWEKAARGTDGRRFPWGDHFDATFCHMRDSRAELPEPAAGGAFEIDESPYGVRDMAGCVADWVVPPADETTRTMARFSYSKGGAWCDWPHDCRIPVRRRYRASERSVRVGFRLVRSVD